MDLGTKIRAFQTCDVLVCVCVCVCVSKHVIAWSNLAKMLFTGGIANKKWRNFAPTT
jgi:hypothetical protein